MIPAPKSPLLWYNHACPPPDRFIAEGVAAGADRGRKARFAYEPTPKPGRFRGILKLVLRGFASHGRGTRPAWQGRRFALPLHPSRPALTPGPSGEPSCSLRPMTEALPLDTIQGRSCPWKPRPRRIALGTRHGVIAPHGPLAGDFRFPAPTTRAFALWTSSRRPSCPCTLTREIRSLDPEQDTPFLHFGRVSLRTRPWGGHGAGDKASDRNRSQRGREAWRMI